MVCICTAWAAHTPGRGAHLELPFQFEVFKLHCPKVGGKLSCGMQDKGDLLEGFDDIVLLRGEAFTALKALLEKRDWEGDWSRLICTVGE